jgi:4-hydroxybenzoate polyprenyltransferase
LNVPVRDLVRALRPKQWTKNAVVFAAFVFALGDTQQQVAVANFWYVLCATICFCLVSSGVYLINDSRDAEADRLHPQKKYRPIASGAVPVAMAVAAGISLIAGSTVLGFALRLELAVVLLGYVALQLAYTFLLKHWPMIDLLVIATGFVLRALAGAVVIDVDVSAWLLVCAFLLAVFLALCKRRQEFVQADLAGTTGVHIRKSLAHYDERLLDQFIAIVASATLVCYVIYTLAPETVDKFGTHHLGFTLPFVLYGLFRYLMLVYRYDLGERPEQVLLTDLPTLVNLALYGAAVLMIIL